MNEMRNSHQNLVRKQTRDLHEYRMIILKWIIKKQDVEVLAGLNWQRTRRDMSNQYEQNLIYLTTFVMDPRHQFRRNSSSIFSHKILQRTEWQVGVSIHCIHLQKKLLFLDTDFEVNRLTHDLNKIAIRMHCLKIFSVRDVSTKGKTIPASHDV
jgi:hypothetical protein